MTGILYNNADTVTQWLVVFNNGFEFTLTDGEGILIISDAWISNEEWVGDANLDGYLNVNDLLAVIDSWGICGGCLADINSDGIVDVSDLLIVVGNWGPCE